MKFAINITLALMLICSASVAYCQQSPEEFVREFYAWYFEVDASEKNPLKQEKIYHYMDKKTINFIDRTAYGHNVNYFTKLGTYADTANIKITIQKGVAIGGDVYVIPVTLFAQTHEHNVIVYVKTKDTLKIIKISDIYPYT